MKEIILTILLEATELRHKGGLLPTSVISFKNSDWYEKDAFLNQIADKIEQKVLAHVREQIKLSNINYKYLSNTKKTEIKYPIGAFAPGFYMNECSSCKKEFVGDKYSSQCEPCAINAVNESNTKALSELRTLKKALEKIKFSNDSIKKILGE